MCTPFNPSATVPLHCPSLGKMFLYKNMSLFIFSTYIAYVCKPTPQSPLSRLPPRSLDTPPSFSALHCWGQPMSSSSPGPCSSLALEENLLSDLSPPCWSLCLSLLCQLLLLCINSKYRNASGLCLGPLSLPYLYSFPLVIYMQITPRSIFLVLITSQSSSCKYPMAVLIAPHECITSTSNVAWSEQNPWSSNALVSKTHMFSYMPTHLHAEEIPSSPQ